MGEIQNSRHERFAQELAAGNPADALRRERGLRKLSVSTLKNPRHEAFAQALARGMSASAAYAEVGFKPHRHNAATLARKKHILARVSELQEQQLAIHQQATAEAAANAKVTIESLIAEAEAARVKAMCEKGGAGAAVTALTAKAKLAGMWREKVDQHNTGRPVYERIERVIVERAPQSTPNNHDEATTEEPAKLTEVTRDFGMPRRHWSV
jgi:hypothetical protein